MQSNDIPEAARPPDPVPPDPVPRDPAPPVAQAPDVADVADGRARAGAVVLAVGALAVVLAWAPSDLFDLERYLVPKSLALHATALGMVVLGLVPLRRRSWDLPDLLMAGFVAWSALAAALAANRWLAFSGWGVSFSAALVFLGARSLPARLRWRALGAILGAVVLGAALGLAQAYGLESRWLSDSRPPGGTFGNRNFLGHVAAIAAPGVLMWTVCSRRKAAVAAGLLGLAVLAAVVVLTRSRAAWLAAIGGLVAALLGLWWTGRRGGLRPARLAAASAVVGAAVGLAVLVPNELDWRTDSPYASTLGRLADFQQGSGRGRLIQYRNSLALVRRNPVFGSGPGNWLVDYPLVTTPGDPAYAGAELIPTNPWPSSDWVALLAERGAVGMLLLLAAGGAAVLVALRSEPGSEPRRAAATGVVAGALTAALVCGAFDAVLLLAAPSFLTWATVGLMLPRRPVAEPGAGTAGWPRGVATAVAVLLALYTGAHVAAIALTAQGTGTRTLAQAALFAPGEHRLQLVLGQRGRCENARRAARLMPHHSRVTRLGARCG